MLMMPYLIKNINPKIQYRFFQISQKLEENKRSAMKEKNTPPKLSLIN